MCQIKAYELNCFANTRPFTGELQLINYTMTSVCVFLMRFLPSFSVTFIVFYLYLNKYRTKFVDYAAMLACTGQNSSEFSVCFFHHCGQVIRTEQKSGISSASGFCFHREKEICWNSETSISSACDLCFKLWIRNSHQTANWNLISVWLVCVLAGYIFR